MLVVLLFAAALLGSFAFSMPTPLERWPLSATAIGLLVLAWLFSSLTVDVDANNIQWFFGPGLWRYQIALSEIESVQVVRNEWWNGFGLRMRPGFRLYNVSGMDAVELRLKNGGIRRIGTTIHEVLPWH